MFGCRDTRKTKHPFGGSKYPKQHNPIPPEVSTAEWEGLPYDLVSKYIFLLIAKGGYAFWLIAKGRFRYEPHGFLGPGMRSRTPAASWQGSACARTSGPKPRSRAPRAGWAPRGPTSRRPGRGGQMWLWSKRFWIPFWKVGAIPPILEPILVGIGMFTGCTIWIWTHGHVLVSVCRNLWGDLFGFVCGEVCLLGNENAAAERMRTGRVGILREGHSSNSTKKDWTFGSCEIKISCLVEFTPIPCCLGSSLGWDKVALD